jgi:hypothetical protein
MKTVFKYFQVAIFATVCSGAAFGADQCLITSRDAQKSCKAEAESDFLLELAKCDNATSDAAECRDDAASERQETLQGCNDEFEARQPACEKLGPAAYDPEIDPADFVAVVDNPYFPLTPGTTFVYEGETPDGLEHSEFFVTHRTRMIMGVRCVEVLDRVWLDGKLAEYTLDWFAQDADGNVWYFGENTREVENGLIATIDGTFMAGVDGAKPGIIMKATPRVGDFYRQEFDLRNAEDFAEVTGRNATVTVPAGTFKNCLKTRETTPLEPDLREDKFYASGVGNVLTIDRNSGSMIKLLRIKKAQ